ncbi:hypothetical protein HL653_12500 [Sphingomonas sp. AP4-R1]|uniref:DUF5818 domain-containing protein n=1 Tax=Sphingomonas sp. AP4-R1 TaxID=2735134 RepID=UPI001493A1C4|nr:DUF5818 domain-containing protein [Sphingomonas sp. AP4-R1]QJU58474.1 hypothetical protein HL653_12500 [Sphingomonas sp. AP4-R1]
MTDSKAPLRLYGILRLNERGPFLEIDEGPLWRLQTDSDLRTHQDRSVRVEAWQRGASILELLWIGPA